jgi:hypothetical protein
MVELTVEWRLSPRAAGPAAERAKANGTANRN